MYWIRLFLLMVLSPKLFREYRRAMKITGASDPTDLARICQERLGFRGMATSPNPIVFDPERPAQMAKTIYFLREKASTSLRMVTHHKKALK